MILGVVNGDAHRPALDFGAGRFLRHVFGYTYEWVDLGGSHLRYQCALPITYENTLDKQLRATK